MRTLEFKDPRGRVISQRILLNRREEPSVPGGLKCPWAPRSGQGLCLPAAELCVLS
jgi:hypothetical protein